MHKSDAHRAITRAIYHGTLVNPKVCANCGKTNCRIYAHHEDDDNPLDVHWLCHRCHTDAHLEMRRRPNGLDVVPRAIEITKQWFN